MISKYDQWVLKAFTAPSPYTNGELYAPDLLTRLGTGYPHKMYLGKALARLERAGYVRSYHSEGYKLTPAGRDLNGYLQTQAATFEEVPF